MTGRTPKGRQRDAEGTSLHAKGCPPFTRRVSSYRLSRRDHMEGMRLQRVRFVTIFDATSNRLYRAKPRAPPPPNSGQSAPGHLALARNICATLLVWRSQTSGGETSSRVASATAYNVRSYKNMRTRGVHLRVVLVDAWGRSPGAVCGWVWLPRSVRAVDILKMIPIDVTAGEATLK